MSAIQASTRSYLAALAAATAGVAVVAVLQSSSPDRHDTLVAVAFCGLQALAIFFPLELAPQQKFSLHTAVIFAAVLLFDPGTAMLIAGVGTLIAQVLRRQPGHDVLFNSCQVALQAGLAGLLLTLADRPAGMVTFERIDSVIAVVGAALVIELIDIAAVGIVVRLESGQPLRSLFYEVPVGSLLDDLSQFAFGLLTAIAVNAHVWTLPIAVLLAYQLHRASRRSLAAQQHEQRLRAESERTAYARQEFLLTASHELKTPITTVRMATQLLDRALIQRQPAFQVDETSILRWRDQLMLGVARLEDLVADLLDAARIQQGRLELHPEHIDLAAVARDVIERFEYGAERMPYHRLILDTPDRVAGYWDPSGMDQVLTNLVSNALKYSPDGGDVTLRIREEGNEVVLRVIDVGVGISSTERAELFRPFARVGAPKYGISGTGLGLYITKRMVEHHGGTIAVESIPSIGTTFTVTLPCFPATGVEARPSEAEMATPLER